jgi:hypothetical protein
VSVQVLDLLASKTCIFIGGYHRFKEMRCFRLRRKHATSILMSSGMTMEAEWSSETFVSVYNTTRRHALEEENFHSYITEYFIVTFNEVHCWSVF